MFILSLWTGPVRVAMFLRAGLVRIANLLWIKLLVKLEECFFEPLDDKYEDNPVGLAYIDLVRRKWPVVGVCILCIWEAPIVLTLFKSLSVQGCGLTYARPLMDGYGMCLPSSQNNCYNTYPNTRSMIGGARCLFIATVMSPEFPRLSVRS